MMMYDFVWLLMKLPCRVVHPLHSKSKLLKMQSNPYGDEVSPTRASLIPSCWPTCHADEVPHPINESPKPNGISEWSYLIEINSLLRVVVMPSPMMSRSYAFLKGVLPCCHCTTLIMRVYPSCASCILLSSDLMAKYYGVPMQLDQAPPWCHTLPIQHSPWSMVITMKTNFAMR